MGLRGMDVEVEVVRCWMMVVLGARAEEVAMGQAALGQRAGGGEGSPAESSLAEWAASRAMPAEQRKRQYDVI